jgi:NTP pyrophosphatase (non-canonical NTP hydrolase)
MIYPVYLTRIGNGTAELIDDEISHAKAKHGEKPFNSTHEGFAVLKEEVDELWDAVKSDASNEQLRVEAVQVAAMAIRFINELTYYAQRNNETRPIKPGFSCLE